MLLSNDDPARLPLPRILGKALLNGHISPRFEPEWRTTYERLTIFRSCEAPSVREASLLGRRITVVKPIGEFGGLAAGGSPLSSAKLSYGCLLRPLSLPKWIGISGRVKDRHANHMVASVTLKEKSVIVYVVRVGQCVRLGFRTAGCPEEAESCGLLYGLVGIHTLHLLSLSNTSKPVVLMR